MFYYQHLKNQSITSKVKFKNILIDGEYSYGFKLENISYLTVEEQLVEGLKMSADSGNFEVFAATTILVKCSIYATKAFIPMVKVYTVNSLIIIYNRLTM